MKYYVLKYADGSLVGIDGGYPYEAWVENDTVFNKFSRVEMWPYTEKGKERALEYLNAFKNSSRIDLHFTLAVLECEIKNLWD